MSDEWEFSSNCFECSVDHSNFCPIDQPLTQPHPQENFHFDSTALTTAVFPTYPLKRQGLESISCHDIQNSLGILCDSALSSALIDPTLRSFNYEKSTSCSQVSSPDCIVSELFDCPRSRSIYPSESNKIKSDGLVNAYYGAPILPGTRFLQKDIQSYRQIFHNIPTAGGAMDQPKKTDPIQTLIRDLLHPEMSSNNDTPVGSTSAVSTPLSPFEAHSCIEQMYNQFVNPPSTWEQSRSPIELKENESLSVTSEIDKNKESSERGTAKVKRFRCPECGHGFARAYNLQTHIATHAGARPFSCPVNDCSKAFSRRHDLARHVLSVHKEWLAAKNLSVAEAVKSFPCKKKLKKSNSN